MRAILLALFIASAFTVFVKRNNDPNQILFAQLEAMEDHELGRKLLDTIALQLNNKAPLSDIAKMLQQLRENLVLSQKEADQKHAQDEVDCETEIYQYNRRIDWASQEITDSTGEITTLSGKVAQLTTEIENKTVQLDILNEQETELRQQRQDDAAKFAAFETETEQVIEAVDLVISKLGQITPDAEPLAALLELNKIGKSNPILALMQVASTFSQAQLDNVIGKLQEVGASLQQALVDARAAETQAIIDFEALIIEIAAQRESLSNARQDAERQLTETQQALDLQKKRKQDASDELQVATAGKVQKEAECAALRQKYHDDTEHRNQETAIIRQVEEILATKLSGVKVYLQERQTI